MGREFGRKLGRFGLVGLVSTLLYVVIAAIGNNATALQGEVVNTVAFGVSGVWSYIGHYHITFRADVAHRSSAVKFFVLFGTGYGMSSGIVMLDDLLGLPRNLATVLVAVALPVMNFIVMQLWVFAGRRVALNVNAGPLP